MNSSANSAFFEKLVRHGLVIPVGVPGAFGRGAVFEKVLQRVDDHLTHVSGSDDSEIYTFPPVINRQILEKVRYFDSFPHLCGTVHSFSGNEAQAKTLATLIRDGGPWSDRLQMTDLVLNPAACYPLYPTLSGTLNPHGQRVTMLNWVFRHEPSEEPTRMQSFRVREFVALGTADEVTSWRSLWLERALAVLQSFELDIIEQAASDPCKHAGIHV